MPENDLIGLVANHHHHHLLVPQDLLGDRRFLFRIELVLGLALDLVLPTLIL